MAKIKINDYKVNPERLFLRTSNNGALYGIFYGIKGEDGELETELENIFVQRYADRDYGITAKEFLAAWTYPIKVLEFKRQDAREHPADKRAEYLLENTLEDLDGDYAVENASEPTPAMKAAALTFWTVILAEYVPERCRETGDVIEITREELAEIIDEKESESVNA